MSKQPKKTAVEVVGFDNNTNQVSTLKPLKPLKPLGVTNPTGNIQSVGFDNTVTPSTPTPIEGATTSPQYTQGYIQGSSLKDRLAENQDGWDQFGNFLAQTGIHAVAGTLEGGSYLADLEQHMNVLKGQEKEYSNWFADQIKKQREDVIGEVPIYKSQENETFNPSSAEWWAANGGQGLGSTLSLIIPGIAAAKLGKLAGLAEFGQTVTATIASRLAESTMEANQAYEEAVSKGASPESAAETARHTYNTNWLFALQDFTQFSAITKGLASTAKGKAGTGIMEFFKQAASEGLEEAGQYVVAKEAVNSSLNPSIDYFGKGFSSRLMDYVDDDEFKTATLLGAIGGAAFHGVGTIANKVADVTQGEGYQNLKDKITNTFKRGLQKEQANYVGDEATSQKVTDVEFANQVVDKYNQGKLNDYKQDLESLKKDHNTLGISSEGRQALDHAIDDTDFIINEQAKLKNSNIPQELHKPIILTKLEQRQNGRLITHLDSELGKIEQEVLKNKEISPELLELKKLQTTIKGYEKLTSTNPKFESRVVELTKTFKERAGVLQALDPEWETSLATSRDADLFEKSFQLVSTNEKQKEIKQDLQKLTTKDGVQEHFNKQQEKAKISHASAVAKREDISTEQLKDLITKTKSEDAKNILSSKLQEVIDQTREVNQNKVKDIIDNTFPDDVPPPNTEFPEEQIPSDFPVENQPPIDLGPTNFIPESTAEKWGLTKKDVDDVLERVDLEQKTPITAVTTEQQNKDNTVKQETKERTSVPSWLKEFNSDGTKTVYTNNITGEKSTADKIFAVDPQTGQLLANTPKVKVGDKVILKLENDFQWTLTPGFKPTSTGNYVINVYLEGIDKPIKQLPSLDNPKTEGERVIKTLRDKVIKTGILTTTITSKNVGSIRTSPNLNSLEVLESDFVLNQDTWNMQKTSHKPVLGFIDYNGKLVTPNVDYMNGMPQNTLEAIRDTSTVERSNDLAKLKGKVITFRTAPDGTKRLVGLVPRVLTDSEVGYVINNLSRSIKSKDFYDINSIVYIPKHPSGIYSSKGKKPDVTNSDLVGRSRIHLVNTTKNTADLLIPITGKNNTKLWIVVDSKNLDGFINNRAIPFRVINEDGVKSAAITNPEKQAEVLAKFKELLAKQFKNVNKDNLNSEIRYTDPTDPSKNYDSYYDYLVASNSVQTNLPGSKTLGVGDDSSYSFNQVAVYLDPNPEQVSFTTDEHVLVHGINDVGAIKETPKVYSDKTDVSILDDFFGPEAKLKPATAGSHTFNLITEKELHWFKYNFGNEFLQIAEGVDRIISKHGVEAFGQYHNALVTIADHAPEGTLYHEAFHLVFNTMLSPREQKNILKNYTEEELAEAFEKYKISNGKIKPKQEEVKGFFRKLLQMLRNLIGLKNPIEKLFSTIDNTNLTQEQKNRILNKTFESDSETKYKKLPGFRWISQQEQAITAFTSEIMRLANELASQKNVDVLDILNGQTINAFINTIKDNFTVDLHLINSTDKKTNEDKARFFTYLAMGLGDNIEGYDDVKGSFENTKNPAGFPIEGFKTKVLKDLGRFGFRLSISADNLEVEENDIAERLYDIDSTLLNPSDSLSQRIKLFLSNIPEPVIDNNGLPTDETKKTIFGTTKYLDFRRVDGNLTLKLRDSINPITKLSELSKQDPIVKVVFDALNNELNKGNTQLYNEFAAKYNRDGYYKKTILFGTKVVNLKADELDPTKPNVKTKREEFVKTIDSDRSSSDRTLLGKWREEAVRKKVVDTTGEVNLDKANYLHKRLSDFKKKVSEAKHKKAPIPYDEVKSEFTSILKDLGVTIPVQVWNTFNEITNPGKKYAKLNDLFFGVNDKTLEDLLLRATEGNDPYEGSNVLNKLAKLSADYQDDPRGGAFRNDSGNTEFPINYPSFITEFFNKIEQTPKDITSLYGQDAFYDNNQFLKIASSGNLEVAFTSSIRRNDDLAKEFEDRTEIDSILMRLSSFYNNGGNAGWIFTGTAADKTKQPITLLPKHKGQQAKNFLFSVLKNTINNEVVRIQRLQQAYDRNTNSPLPTDIANYNKAISFKYIPELNSIPNLTETLSSGDITTDQYVEAIRASESVIDKFISNEYQGFVAFLVSNDIIKQDSEGKISNSRIPKGLLENRTLDSMLEEFFYNDLAWRMEISKVLMGDIALYKSTDDYFKRAYQLVTPGIKGYLEDGAKLTRAVYTKQIKALTPEQYNDLVKLTSKSTADRYVQEGINKTDAQSLITIDGYRTLSKSLGQWTNDHELIYSKAWSQNKTVRQVAKELDEQQSKQLLAANSRITLQPFKPFQYNNRSIALPDGKSMLIKEQFKDSITPITPELAAVHSGYKDLLNYMQTNKVDIMSAQDTLKVGSYGVTDLTSPLQIWQKREVDLSDFRFPQLTPEKRKEEILGTQFHKLILGNIEDTNEYKVGNKTLNGKALKEAYNTLWEEKISDSSKELQKELGVGKDFQLAEDPIKRKDQLFKLKVILDNELQSRDLNDNYDDALELVTLLNGQTDFTIPLSFPAFGQKFQSILSNLWKKAILRQKSPGYSAVNMADFGVGYSDELNFITNTNGQVTEAEIGLPIDYLKDIGLEYGKHILPNGRIMWDKLNNNQQEALQFIVYRIPTSNKSSMLPVRVTMITPQQLNNVVIIPGELTIQQGLDFDVDKSQLLRRVLDKDGKIDNTVDTKLFDLYWSILTNPMHTNEMLTPLASPTLVSKVQQYSDLGLVDRGNTSSVFSTQSDVKAEIRNKDGKSEIGVASRYNTGHAVLQNIQDYIGVNTNINIQISDNPNAQFDSLGRDKDAYGTLISENHAESQQAALDSAKDPLLAYIGVVTGTMSAFHTLIDFGLPLSVASDLFMQPVIREWTKFYKQEGQRETKATEKLFSTYPTVKNQYNELLRNNIQLNLTSNGLANGLTKTIGDDTAHDARVLLEFLKTLSIAQQLGRINNVLSIDTFQDTTGVEALEAMIQQKVDATNPEASVYIDSRLFNLETTPPEGKRLAAFYTYGIKDAIKFISQFFPSTSVQYGQVKDYYAASIGSGGLTDKGLIKQLNQFIDYFNLDGNSYLSSRLLAIHPEEKADYRNRWSYFSSDKSLWKYINSLMDKYPALKTNELIRGLESSKIYGDQVQMIGVRNTDGNTDKSNITSAWYDLLQSQNNEIRGLAHDLVRFAIQTSGFNYSSKSMFDLIPVQFWIESGIADNWRDFTHSVDSSNLDKDAIVTSFVRHNFKSLDRFPEIYGIFTKEGFKSDIIKDYKHQKGTQHITEFNIVEEYSATRALPNYFRILDRDLNDYRLYESDPLDGYHFKEVQPLGERFAYTELGADGRNESKHPKNRKLNLSVDPFSKVDGVSKAFPLLGSIHADDNFPIRKYLPEEKNDPIIVIANMLHDETDPVRKQLLQVMLDNVDKINTSIVVEEISNNHGLPVIGMFETTQTSVGIDTIIKINPKVDIDSEVDARRIITHELVHAYSMGVIQNPQGEQQVNFVRNIERIRKELYDNAGFTAYGLTNKAEFIAELASNPDFVKQLRENPKGRMNPPAPSIWSRILRAFRKLFGFKDDFDKILEEYYDIIAKADNLLKINPNQGFNLVEDEKLKPKGSKKLTPIEQMHASLTGRVKRLKAQGKTAKSTALHTRYKQIQKLEASEQIVNYCILVSEEMEKIKQVYQTLAKDPSRINPKILQPIQEQLTSYKLLDSYNRQISRNPEQFSSSIQNIELFKNTLNNLRTDVNRMSESIHKLAINRWASVVKNTTTDPNLTLDKIIEDLEVADRDITFISRLWDVGREIRDESINTLHTLISRVNSNAWRKTQDALYSVTPEKKTAKVTIRVPNPNDPNFHYETKAINYTTVGKFKALTDYEKWVGKVATFNDKFSHVIDQASLLENSDGIQFISPWSKRGKEILSIKEGSKDYPLRQFYETFVLGYLADQQHITAKGLRPGLRIPTIQKSIMEDVLAKGLKEKVTSLKEQAINQIRRRYDEADYYSIDENGNKQEYIPTRFVAKQDGQEGRLNTRQVSLDIATTLALFQNEMETRKGMEDIVSDLELGKSVLANRKVLTNTRMQEGPGISGLLTAEREGNLLESGEYEQVEGIRSESFKAFEGTMRQHVYGQLKKEEGAFKVGKNKYSISKIADALLRYSGFNLLFGNIAIPLTNIVVGKLGAIKEAVGGNIVDFKNLKAGEALYLKEGLGSLKDLGKREKTTKLGRVFAYFNPFEHEQVRGLGTDTNYAKTIFDKIITSGGSIAEFQISVSTIGAVMDRFKAKDSKGQEVSLYDAIEVDQAGKVSLQKGYTYNGKSTISGEDIDEIKDYILRVYQNIYGVGNKLDKPASSEYVIGRLVNFMRGWLIPGINTRWRTKFYDERLKQDQEGHYLSAILAFNNIFTSDNGFIQNTTDSIRILLSQSTKNPEMLLHPNELDLSEEQKDNLINLRKANIRKTMFELYLIIGASALLAFGWDDEDDDSYTKYMLARVRRELVTFISPSTMVDVLKSPTVMLNTIDGFSKIIYDAQNSVGAAVLDEDQPVYQRGPGKDQNKLWFDIKKQTGLNSLTQFDDLETKTRLARNGRR